MLEGSWKRKKLEGIEINSSTTATLALNEFQQAILSTGEALAL